MILKVAITNEQKVQPKGCTHIYLNTIKEVYDWFKITNDAVYVFLYQSQEWYLTPYSISDIGKSKRIVPISLNSIKSQL